MFKLKQIPEDFIVKEVSNREFDDKGHYLICLMKKKNYNTEDAIQTLTRALHVDRKNINYAGTKDRNAITYQYVSFWKGTEERISNLKLKDISLEIKGKSKSPLSLGDLKGNDFEITVRNLDENTKINKIEKFPNYFDSQRFSFQNVDVGKALITKDFEKVCELIKKDNKYGEIVKQSLLKEPRNYLQALLKVPDKILLIYAHAYQSFLWNKTVTEYLKSGGSREYIPLLGFSDLEDDELKHILEKIMKEEKITNRDFIIRELPKISLEGTKRKVFMKIQNLEIGKKENDELNPGKKKIKLKFFLEKGSYATMAIKYLLNEF